MELDVALMSRCDSIYIDALTDGRWEVKALYDCLEGCATGTNLTQTVNEACQNAIDVAEDT